MRIRPLVAVALQLVVGCAQALPAERPPAAAVLYFPGSLAATPDGSRVYIVSTNFDQRYDTGWLTSVDMATLRAQLGAGASIGTALTKEVQILSLGGDLAVATDAASAFLTHRGLGYVTQFDLLGAPGSERFACGQPGGAAGLGSYFARTDCDEQHLLPIKQDLAARLSISHDRRRELLNDPFALAAAGGDDVWLGFLGDSHVVTTSALARSEPTANVLTGPDGSIFAALAQLPDGSLLGAGSQSVGDGFGPVEALLSLWPNGGPASVRQDFFPSRDFSDGRAFDRGPASIERIVASNSSGRIFLLSRGPEAVLEATLMQPVASIIDPATNTVADANTPYAYQLLAAYPMPTARLSDLVYLPRQGGDLLAGISFERDAIYFFDVEQPGLRMVARHRLPTGAGPYRGLAVGDGSDQLLLVSTFGDHGLAVIDLSPALPSDFAVVSMRDEAVESRLARP